MCSLICHRPNCLAMHLKPFVRVDDVSFRTTPAALLRRKGSPLLRAVNDVGLEAFDYGAVVLRFQACGRLEEVTRRAPVLHIGAVAVPFGSLEGFVLGQDPEAFRRAGFLVSPRFGLAFVPGEPAWITALARHCIDTWRGL